jgi:hypothetical protein
LSRTANDRIAPIAMSAMDPPKYISAPFVGSREP